MKTYVIDAHIWKDNKYQRHNFDIKSASSNESSLKGLANEKLKIDLSKWELEKEKFELIDKENVVKYRAHYIEKK